MKIHRLERTQFLPIPVDVAWAFYANVNNLLQVYPPYMKLRIESVTPKEVYPGMVLILKGSVGGFLPIQKVNVVTHVEKPVNGKAGSFVDEQRFGPFAFFHHRHLLEPKGEGTAVTDVVHYAMPFGFAWELAQGMVHQELEKVFAHKEQIIFEYFGEH